MEGGDRFEFNKVGWGINFNKLYIKKLVHFLCTRWGKALQWRCGRLSLWR